ncbi:MAG: hypothetical protein O2858_07885 [Proteobacteria bacterium]|nr:hypothetical protein [Pseudomonadota bacterium]MDA0868721.1 hypothetical protein [Pseudomonadota bacterium]MDA1207581.1 hypothetical protein [Pseudomonadota bacterium]
MTKARHPYFLLLRVLAGKLELGLLSPEEASVLAGIIRRLAEGEVFDEIVGTKRPAGRPVRNTTEHYVEQVFGLMQPTFDGEPGMKMNEAMAIVAKGSRVEVETVKEAYYSKPGRKHLKLVEEANIDPLAFLSSRKTNI